METPSVAAAPERAPLLPPLLLNPASFLWLWVLPTAVLFVLNLQGYWLVSGEMDHTQRDLAFRFGLAGAGNILAGLACYAFARTSPDAPAHPGWGVPGLVAQVGVLALALYSCGESLLPSTVTGWIYPETRFLFNQFAFAMVPLFHGILRLACARAPGSTRREIAVNLGLAVGCPVLLYLAACSLAWLSWDHSHGEWVGFLFVAGIVLLGIVMFIGLTRAVVLGLRAFQDRHPETLRVAVLLVALALPLCGLVLNRGIPFPVDLQAWETYALTIANAGIMMLAVWRADQRPLLNWCLLSATFPFALYFFFIFLPYTPLSILAIIVFGAGFLVLTPTILFVLHLHLLHGAWQEAAKVTARPRLLLAGVLGVLVLPVFFIGRALADRAALNAALDYAYTPTIPAGDITYASSLGNLRRALESHRAYKNGIYYPILSDFYAWAVFDHLVLPDAKQAHLERLFLGQAGGTESNDPARNQRGRESVRALNRMPAAAPAPRTVELEHVSVRVAPAPGQGSVVTANLTLHNVGAAMAEFQQRLALPAGAYVTGFRLQVGSTLVPGRIFEKKTALWVYKMIRDTERRDPGILFYRSPAELELLVFPVNPNARTTVEIDFLVPGVVDDIDVVQRTTTLAGLAQELERATCQPFALRLASDDVVVGGFAPDSLPVVEREPYLHLIVDRSADNAFEGSLMEALRVLRVRYPAAKSARLTLANYDVTDLVRELTPLDKLPAGDAGQWQRLMPKAGSLALDVALAHAIRLHRDADLEPAGAARARRPIFVVLRRRAELRQLDLPLAEAWSESLAGLDLVELDAGGGLIVERRGGGDRPLLRLGNAQRPWPAERLVRFNAVSRAAGPLQYWSPQRGAWEHVPGTERVERKSAWTEAVGLQGLQEEHTLNPGGSHIDLAGLIQASRKSGVLLASSSYIVVENSAQWKMLELSERQKLGQNAALEFKETPAPPAVWIAGVFGLWLLWRRRRYRTQFQNIAA